MSRNAGPVASRPAFRDIMVYSFEAMAYVYIMTNKRRTVLYIGSTPDIAGRTLDHKLGL